MLWKCSYVIADLTDPQCYWDAHSPAVDSPKYLKLKELKTKVDCVDKGALRPTDTLKTHKQRRPQLC